MSEVAAYLKCHPSTVYRLLKVGGLPAFRLGGDWRFLLSEIDKWVTERQVRPYALEKSSGRKRGPKRKGKRRAGRFPFSFGWLL
ncbi:MAG: helix-turn-helix domain-containing protein [Candidatus Binataceae bacterium]